MSRVLNVVMVVVIVILLFKLRSNDVEFDYDKLQESAYFTINYNKMQEDLYTMVADKHQEILRDLRNPDIKSFGKHQVMNFVEALKVRLEHNKETTKDWPTRHLILVESLKQQAKALEE